MFYVSISAFLKEQIPVSCMCCFLEQEKSPNLQFLKNKQTKNIY